MLPYKINDIDNDQLTREQISRRNSDNTTTPTIKGKEQPIIYKMEVVVNTPELIRMQLNQIDSNITQLKLHLETIEAIGEDNGEKIDNIRK